MDAQRSVLRAVWMAGALLLLLMAWLILSAAAPLEVITDSPGAVLVVVLLGVLAGGLLLLKSLRRQTGFSSFGDIIASDTKQGREILLWDEELGIRGKPDVVRRQWVGLSRKIVTGEVKPSRRGRSVYPWDRVQAGSYAVMARAHYGRKAARFALVRYATGTFRVNLGRALLKEIDTCAQGVRRVKAGELAHRDHKDAWRCQNCPLKEACSERLAWPARQGG